LLTLTLGMVAPLPALEAQQAPHRQTFTSPAGVFQFTYPSSYELYTGSKAGHAGSSYISVCESAAACVLYPRSTYEGTNFEAASFREREISDATAESACLAPPAPLGGLPEFVTDAKDPSRNINGVRFTHALSGDAGMGHYLNSDLYRAFHQGKCYELSINVAITSFANFDPGAVKEFTHEDDQHVRAELATILDSFKFLR
jgi:hypothetical protein